MTVWCAGCSGEGRLYQSRYGGNDPDTWDAGLCEACNGSGVVRCETCTQEAHALSDISGEYLCEEHLLAEAVAEFRVHPAHGEGLSPAAREGHVTGAEFRMFRKALGLSQSEMATALGVSPATIIRWEFERASLNGAVVTLIEMIGAMHWSLAHPMREWLKARGKAA